MTSLPPGPGSSLGFMLAYLRNPLECGIQMVRKHGPTHTIPGKPPMVITGDPAAIQAIYAADPDAFVPANQQMGAIIGQHSLLLLGGAEHRAARKLLMPPFHGARMRTYGQLICRLALEHTRGWSAGKRVVALETAQGISMDVILQAVFGVTDQARMKEMGQVILEILDGISPLVAAVPALRREFLGVGPWAAFKRRQRRLHQAFDQAIAAARASPGGQDILAMLLQARDEDGNAMPDDEVKDHLLTLVLAGHETTAIAIAWTLHALHLQDNAAVLTRLREELHMLGDTPTPEELMGLPYLEAVCQETLRRYPLAPAPSPRKLLKPLDLPRWQLPAGVSVVVGIGYVHFNEQLYPDPMRFRPERFLERTFSPFEFIPFGGGARRCLGAALATYEMRLVVGTLLRRFRLRLESQKPDKGVVRAANVGPKTGIPMVVEG